MTLTRGPVKKCITFWFSVWQCDHALLCFVAVIEKHLLDPIQVMYVRHALSRQASHTDPTLVEVKLYFENLWHMLDLVNFSRIESQFGKVGWRTWLGTVHNRMSLHKAEMKLRSRSVFTLLWSQTWWCSWFSCSSEDCSSPFGPPLGFSHMATLKKSAF